MARPISMRTRLQVARDLLTRPGTWSIRTRLHSIVLLYEIPHISRAEELRRGRDKARRELLDEFVQAGLLEDCGDGRYRVTEAGDAYAAEHGGPRDEAKIAWWKRGIRRP